MVSRGSQLIFVNGQVSRDVSGATVGVGDVLAQLTQSLRNLRAALVAVGADGQDVVQYRVSVVNYDESLLAPLLKAFADEFDGSPIIAAGAIIGVSALGRADYLVEVEAIATLA
ncbi:MAG: enamine deaminase RidA [Jatrophihabitans sp.]|nr:enamine deaminase RidA [Jatrophihabitans sp.]